MNRKCFPKCQKTNTDNPVWSHSHFHYRTVVIGEHGPTRHDDAQGLGKESSADPDDRVKLDCGGDNLRLQILPFLTSNWFLLFSLVVMSSLSRPSASPSRRSQTLVKQMQQVFSSKNCNPLTVESCVLGHGTQSDEAVPANSLPSEMVRFPLFCR